MSKTTVPTPSPFTAIIGGAPQRSGPRYSSLPQLDTPPESGPELAVELAEIFAISLMRLVPVDQLADPHHVVPLDGLTQPNLHEILCELRSLPWFDQLAQQLDDGAKTRRARRLNRTGQLTLTSMLSAGVTGDSPAQMSTLWGDAAPSCLQAMLDGLLSVPVHDLFESAMITAVQNGTAFDPGIGADHPLTAADGMSDMITEATSRATRTTLHQMNQPARWSRPAVTSARMTAWLARAEASDPNDDTPYRHAAEILQHHAPQLLHWVSVLNRRLRQGQTRFDTSLFLPLQEVERQTTVAADLTPQVAVTGALATLAKAVFDTTRTVHDPACQPQVAALTLGREVTHMAANVSLARLIAGHHHPIENAQDLRSGEAIALNILRDRLEQANRPATLSFVDFGGQPLRIDLRKGLGARGQAVLTRGNRPAPWPGDTLRTTPHLTAV
ncbi:hypothetical protein [Sagittula sp. SSi028]|uniref:hypothetical protein n=1 Tax=Sagittula sp. SSi028 TaxID=3400636 RepID=UPI003AF87E4A